MVTDEFWSWLLPMVDVATTWPEELTLRRAFERPLRNSVPTVSSEVEAWWRLMRLEKVVDAEKRLLPENVLLSPRSVVDATTIFAVPLNETPLMVRAVWRAVAVPALPETDPEIVLLKVSVPENVLLSPSNVVEATVMVPPREKETPLIVPRMPVM